MFTVLGAIFFLLYFVQFINFVYIYRDYFIIYSFSVKWLIEVYSEFIGRASGPSEDV